MEPSADLVLARETPARRRGSRPGSGGRRGRPQWGGALLRNETRAGKGRILALSAPGLGTPELAKVSEQKAGFPRCSTHPTILIRKRGHTGRSPLMVTRRPERTCG